MAERIALYWIRQDLRLKDNPALTQGAKNFRICPVFIWDPQGEGNWQPGAASQSWLHHSLVQLQQAYQDKGLQLVIRAGESLKQLQKLQEETGASALFWNRRYEPAIVERDGVIKEHFKNRGIEVQSFNGALMLEPWEVSTQQKTPYKVFSPFWKQHKQVYQHNPPLECPRNMTGISKRLPSLAVKDLGLLPQIPWDHEFYEYWQPGEASAVKLLDRFVNDGVERYSINRDRPAVEGTSSLSPHLHFGEISPRQIWHKLKAKFASRLVRKEDSVETYGREIGWREFAYHLLFYFPQTTDSPLRQEFEKFPWQNRPRELSAWQKGQTGYPIIDAGMRQLWTTGWMHNRVRMIVASFLVKDLLISWQEGSKWFWDTLVDADLASNTLGWQWAGGCGADAAPYFRVFNPVLQGEKFDPDGDYVGTWVPELAKVPPKYIHQPWTADRALLKSHGVILGKDYPEPLVDHKRARIAALAAYEKLKKDK